MMADRARPAHEVGQGPFKIHDKDLADIPLAPFIKYSVQKSAVGPGLNTPLV